MITLKKIYAHILKGFSYYLPFVIIGALLSQLSQFFESHLEIYDLLSFSSFFVFQLSYIVLSGFIAYAVSDRLAILPGFVAGIFTVRFNMGFISAVLLGLLAGYMIKYFKMLIKVSPSYLRQTLTIVWIPLFSVIVIYLMAEVMTLFMPSVTLFNESVIHDMPIIFVILLTGFLAACMAYDLGGPINKIAYMIAISTIGLGNESVFIPAVMAGGMIPPLAIGLYHMIFSEDMRELKHVKGYQVMLGGSFFISESALPFYYQYGKRISIVSMMGSFITGALIAYFQITSNVVHGGIFMFWTTSDPLTYLVVMLVGIIMTTSLFMLTLKRKK